MTDSRHVLLIDWHFGNPGATGGARWRAMATTLTGDGWRFDVVTVGAAMGPDGEEWRPGIRLHRVPLPTFVDDAIALAARGKRALRGGGPTPTGAPASAVPAAAPVPGAGPAPRGGLYQRLLRFVDALRITLPEWVWTRRAARRARDLARRTGYRAVIVSSPPHLTQRAGATVARWCGLPYVADFRDPWVFGRPEKYDVNMLANPLGRLFEARTLRRAALVVGNTEHARRAVAGIYPALAARTVAIANGYDADGTSPGMPDAAVFRIAFAGWLYPFMDPEVVLAAAGRLRRRAALGPATLAVEFMGCAETYRGVAMDVLARGHGLEGCFRWYPASPRAEARRLQASAAVLVAYDASTQLAMPTKFYDYAQMHGTMLLLGFTDGALAAAAAELGLRVHAPDDDDGIDAALDAAYARWREGRLTAPADREGKMDRRRQAARVGELLAGLPRA